MLRQRSYLSEGKKISIEWPERPGQESPRFGTRDENWAHYQKERQRTKRIIAMDVPKVFTWTDEKMGFVSLYSVMRIVSSAGNDFDYIFQIYDVDPESKNKRGKIRLNVRIKGVQRVIELGMFDNASKAKKAANEWFADMAYKRGADEVQRVSLKMKPKRAKFKNA